MFDPAVRLSGNGKVAFAKINMAEKGTTGSETVFTLLPRQVFHLHKTLLVFL
jgi:hypothetical protein